MTAPATPAPPSDVAEAFKAEARERHSIYRGHVEHAHHCECATGGLCPRGRRLLAEADDAGKKAERAGR